MGLAELPLELIWLILERLHCAPDLHSAFCASPILLQPFLAAREHLIVSVLARAILPAAQRLAIATTEAPVAPREEQLGELRNFLDGYFDDEKHDRPTVFPDSRLKLMNLMWLHSKVELLALQYYEEAKAYFIIFLKRQAGSQLLEPLPKFAELSRTEIARFQRAFYRFELYSRCFGVSAREKWVEPTGHEAAAPFSRVVLRPLALLGLGNRGSLSSSHRNLSQGPQNTQDISKDNVPGDDDDLCEFNWSVESDLRLFSSHEREWFYHWVSDATSFGLIYITGFLDSPRDVQYNLFLHNTSKSRTFLPHVLTDVDFNALRGTPLGEDERAIPSPATSEEDKKHKDDRDNQDDLSSPNPGYELFKDGPGYPTIPLSDNKFWPLRRPGYVFWDSSRVLEPRFRECLVDARDGNDRDYDLTKKPSAEEVLKGVVLPKRAMHEVRKKYGIQPWGRE